MILVFDLSNVGVAHLSFDHGYLQVLRHAFPDEPIRFFGEPEHCALLAGMEPPDSPVRFDPGPFLGKLGADRFRPWVALPRAWRVVRAARAIAEAERPSFVAFVSEVSPATALAVRHLWTDRSAPPVDLILHSDIASVSGWRSRNPLLRMTDWHAVLKRPAVGRVRFVALERGIRDGMLAGFPQRAADTMVLDHPVPEAELCDVRPTPADPLNIGFIGDSTAAKGFGTFLELARAVPGPRYHVLGRLIDPLPADAPDILMTPPATRPLPRADLIERLRALDLAVLPLTRPAYDWTASGTLIDCLTNLVPVVTTRTRVTEALFADHGPIGVLVERPEDVIDTIRSIDATWLSARREVFTHSLRAARAARLPAALARTYPGLCRSDP
jgi:hypothetical protein